MIDLQLLGGLTVDSGGLSPNARALHRRPLALVALIAAASPQPVGRTKLMAMLWPESDAERASNSLRQTLFWLRRELGEDLFFPETAGGIRINPAAAKVDLWAFREAIERDAPDEALAAYRGPFLEGFQVPGASEFSHWCETERARIVRQYIEALETLARSAESDGRHDDAVAWCRRQATADPLSSRAALALLKALVAAGDRTGALQYASIYENLVRVQLETHTDPAIMEFVERLRRHSPADARGRSEDKRASEPLPESADTATAGAMAKLITRGRHGRSVIAPRALWLAGAAIIMFGILAGWTYSGRSSVPSAERTVIVLASGVANVGGRDRLNQIISCDGPACPHGGFPQDAYVLIKHADYTLPVTGTTYIAPIPDGTAAEPPGFRCCTTAVFENVFTLPSDAVSARITISALADNQAIASINGTEFGRQADSTASWNFAGPAATFTTTFVPEPGGTNRLRVTLWDGGGAIGLQYHAVVTHETNPVAAAPPKPLLTAR